MELFILFRNPCHALQLKHRTATLNRMGYCCTTRDLRQHDSICRGVDPATILIHLAHISIKDAPRTDGAHLWARKFSGWVWSRDDVWRWDQASVPEEKRRG